MSRAPQSRGGSARRVADAPPAPGRALPFAAGFAAGVLVAVLVWLAGLAPSAEGPAPRETAEGGAVPPPGIRFEFPDMLRDAEVLVPYVEEYLQPEATPEPDVDYLLQAGAFRNSDDAERRRAAILLLDLSARTLRVTRQGETWHRVLVGPFTARDDVRDAQVRLLEDDIDSIVLKTRREAEG
jgi:cell division protein FtsN